MSSRQLGPWKLAVKDRAGAAFERFIATDGKELTWVWRSTGATRGNFAAWEELKPPWLPAVAGPRTGGEPVLLSEYRPGVPLGDLLHAASGEGLPQGAAAALALAVARGLEQLTESIDPDDVPQLVPESILIGFDGAVSLMPWPDVWATTSDGPGDGYLADDQAYGATRSPGWRVFAPALVLLHASDRVARLNQGRLSHRVPKRSRASWKETLEQLPAALKEVAGRALHSDPEERPALGELIEALTPLASQRELEDAVARHLAHEPKEQRFDRAIAEGKDPEPLPPAMVASISQGATDSDFGVLADWLLAEGYPRGELAAIQLKLERGAQHELMRVEAQLLSRHRSLLPISLRERLQFWKPTWKAGWLTGLELKAVPESEVLHEILSHPTLRFLRRLRVQPDGGGSKVLTDVLSTLNLPALRQVELDGGVHIHGVRLRQARPQLNVESSKSTRGFPARRRPEASSPNARVGVGDREPAPGLPPLNRLIDWLSGDD